MPSPVPTLWVAVQIERQRQPSRWEDWRFRITDVLLDEGPDKGKPAFTPYVILERTFTDETGAAQRLKIGVIGFVPPQIMQWDRLALTGRVKPRDIPQTAREWVPKMRAEGADVVVVLPLAVGVGSFVMQTHLGYLFIVPANSRAVSSTGTRSWTWRAAPSTACPQ